MLGTTEPDSGDTPYVGELVFVNRSDGWEELWTEGPTDHVLQRVGTDARITAEEFERFLTSYDYSVTVGFYVTNRVKVVHEEVLQRHKEFSGVENLIRFRNLPQIMLSVIPADLADPPTDKPVNALTAMRRMYVKIALRLLDMGQAPRPVVFRRYVDFFHTRV